MTPLRFCPSRLMPLTRELASDGVVRVTPSQLAMDRLALQLRLPAVPCRAFLADSRALQSRMGGVLVAPDGVL